MFSLFVRHVRVRFRNERQPEVVKVARKRENHSTLSRRIAYGADHLPLLPSANEAVFGVNRPVIRDLRICDAITPVAIGPLRRQAALV